MAIYNERSVYRPSTIPHVVGKRRLSTADTINYIRSAVLSNYQARSIHRLKLSWKFWIRWAISDGCLLIRASSIAITFYRHLLRSICTIIKFHYLDEHDHWTLRITLHITRGIKLITLLVGDLSIEIVVHDAISFSFVEAWVIRFCNFVEGWCKYGLRKNFHRKIEWPWYFKY